MTAQSSDIDPQQLRRQLRQRRRQISPYQQRHAAHRLLHHMRRNRVYQGARHIAFYQACAGEISPALLLRHAWRHGRHCYLPVMHPLRHGSLLFVRVGPQTRLYRDRWGIWQPRPHAVRIRRADKLDLVLVPLVGFDRQGHRMGMGKGFYDRCFAFRLEKRRRPYLIGLGHTCQEVPGGLEAAGWDVRMDAIATPDGLSRIRAMRFEPHR